MGSFINLLAFVIFTTSLFMRSVDPVIPQVAAGLAVTTATAAMLSTAFTCPMHSCNLCWARSPTCSVKPG